VKYHELIKELKNLDGEYEAYLYLVTEIACISKSYLYLHLQDEIPLDILNKINDAINKYHHDKIPVQYIIGYTYFYGLKIYVNDKVLIPRPETEEVVERVIKESKNYIEPKIVDIGTGSGCIAIALKKMLPKAKVYAIDISKDALEVARYNASRYNLDITFLENNLLEGINEKFDIIVSNPPYIDPDEEVMSLVYNHEPHLALFSPEGGLYHYRKILEQAKVVLKENGVIILEIAYNKKSEMLKLANGFTEAKVYQDLNQKDRIMVIR